MPETPPIGNEDSEPSGRPIPGAARTLRTVALPTIMEKARIKLLEELVFSRVQVIKDVRKDYLTHQNLLRTGKSHTVCTIIWNFTSCQHEESPFIKNNSAIAGSVTQHGLAVALSESPSDVAKLNTLIRDVGLAGEAYGLIERIPLNPTRVYLKGTQLLDVFMNSLADSYCSIIQNATIGRPQGNLNGEDG
jgi:hypothetical protein